MVAMQYERPLLFLLNLYHHSFLIFNCVIYKIMLGFVSFVRDARSSALELSLQKLGIEKLTKRSMQPWLASGTWNQIMHVTVKVLLAGERKICNQIFDGITFNKDQCFAEVTGSSVMTLLSFGDVIAKSKRSHENLFVLLEMYGLMHGLRSEVEVTFQGKFCSGMREAALSLTKSLAQAVQETLVDFEVAVEKNNSKTTVQNGNLHPFTIELPINTENTISAI
ncbi:Exocyst complex component EXO70A1 [Zea mays]|uniref:Exocyst subunit Exo70 family protein n=1 Tax=Zea mays TaxID=4577 RepID=A0A1D6ITF4_MAIZE|nr:Exocyst complex component EXO70A1 [Zea mays]